MLNGVEPINIAAAARTKVGAGPWLDELSFVITDYKLTISMGMATWDLSPSHDVHSHEKTMCGLISKFVIRY